MRLASRATWAAVAALSMLLSWALVSTSSAAFKLLTDGTTVLVMGGTGHSLSSTEDTVSFVEGYLAGAIGNYVGPASNLDTSIPEGPYNAVAVVTPEQFAPGTGTLTFDQSVALGQQNLDNCIKGTSCNYNTDVGSITPTAGDAFVVYGFSQSATIATLEKRSLAAEYAYGDGPAVTFVLIANGNRPNGGFLSRGPTGVTIPWFLQFGGATFSGPTPTDTQYATVDIAAQYDGWSDFPVNPLNLLPDINALMGITYLHLGGVYDNTSLTDSGVIDQGQYGDTHYYLISTDILPLLMPLENLGTLGYALADTLDPALRVIIESAYDRSTSPGQPTSWNIFYFEDPIKLTKDFIAAIPTGLDNGLEDLFGVRPFKTTRPGPYGVGGTGVTYTDSETSDSSTASSTATDSTSATSSAAAESTSGVSSSSSSASADSSSSTTTSASGVGHAKPRASSTSSKTATAAQSTSTSSSSGSTKSTHSGVGSSKRAKAS
ncbi:PE-PPE domain-containing protein [Mycobacterium crocinum]|uniref:PE-PPE domain-containing protein n=1 Tax=Mycolicibacterium crocinum TaxID=388459 RepID=A0ABY3TCS3_9MYCO|nr:PE-PPE domain-containing protein [Mycolicibacterium crocinum]MCV7218622.1 PE-PPE domain-containing protein [Mycolicibacterium crocinum]ULN39231.1 PE-PPE domain-containing protein [Mycolicibacterium crocinum]